MSKENILRLEHVTMQFGGVVAVNDLSLEVNRGEIVALIGPNGAGKTTAFNCITGVYEPTNGLVTSTASPGCMSPPTAGCPFWGGPWWKTTPRARWSRTIREKIRGCSPR